MQGEPHLRPVKWCLAASSPSAATQPGTCRPDPSGPPAKSWNTGSILPNAPPSLASTMPVRMITTRSTCACMARQGEDRCAYSRRDEEMGKGFSGAASIWHEVGLQAATHLVGGRLPLAAHVGEKVVPGRGRLVEGRRLRAAVEANGRGRQEDLGPLAGLQGVDGLDEALGCGEEAGGAALGATLRTRPCPSSQGRAR